MEWVYEFKIAVWKIWVSSLSGGMRGISWVCLCFCLFEKEFYCWIPVGTEIKPWSHVKSMALLDGAYLVFLLLSCRLGRTKKAIQMEQKHWLRSSFFWLSSGGILEPSGTYFVYSETLVYVDCLFLMASVLKLEPFSARESANNLTCVLPLNPKFISKTHSLCQDWIWQIRLKAIRRSSCTTTS